MNNITNQVAYLRTSREFPEDLHEMSVESNKAYIDVAGAVNSRTIGTYPVNTSAITGNTFFITNKRQQTLRKVYVFTTTTDIDLGFKLSSIANMAQMYGTYKSTAGGNFIFGLVPGTNVAIAGQISFYIVEVVSTTSDVIRFVLGAGAPALDSGLIVLEWITNK